VVVLGVKQDHRVEIRYDAIFPSLFQIRSVAWRCRRYHTPRRICCIIRQTFSRELGGSFVRRGPFHLKIESDLQGRAITRHPRDDESHSKKKRWMKRMSLNSPYGRAS